MAEPASDRSPIETLTLAGIGALAVAAGRADDLADDLAGRLGVDRDEMRAALGDALGTWQREARRLGRSTTGAASKVAQELGVATQDAVDDLQLRVAQLEHRLKLLERS